MSHRRTDTTRHDKIWRLHQRPVRALLVRVSAARSWVVHPVRCRGLATRCSTRPRPLLGAVPTEISFFFFFQAEDGIRDLTVTGVQTCALPISTTTREQETLPLVRDRPVVHRLPRRRMGRPPTRRSRAFRVPRS